MAKNRDERGRFVKGVTPEGAVPFSEGVAKEMQLRSAEARKENRIVADALRRALMGKDPETGDPYIVAIATKTVERMKGQGGIGDLRVAADILGELEQKVTHEGGNVPIQLELANPDALAGLKKALATGAAPRKPIDEQ